LTETGKEKKGKSIFKAEIHCKIAITSGVLIYDHSKKKGISLTEGCSHGH
jgi:hypothetical protein